MFTARYELNPDIHINFVLVSKRYVRCVMHNTRIHIRQSPPRLLASILLGPNTVLRTKPAFCSLLKRGFTHYAVHKDRQLHADGHKQKQARD